MKIKNAIMDGLTRHGTVWEINKKIILLRRIKRFHFSKTNFINPSGISPLNAWCEKNDKYGQ